MCVCIWRYTPRTCPGVRLRVCVCVRHVCACVDAPRDPVKGPLPWGSPPPSLLPELRVPEAAAAAGAPRQEAAPELEARGLAPRPSLLPSFRPCFPGARARARARARGDWAAPSSLRLGPLARPAGRVGGNASERARSEERGARRAGGGGVVAGAAPRGRAGESARAQDGGAAAAAAAPAPAPQGGEGRRPAPPSAAFPRLAACRPPSPPPPPPTAASASAAAAAAALAPPPRPPPRAPAPPTGPGPSRAPPLSLSVTPTRACASHQFPAPPTRPSRVRLPQLFFPSPAHPLRTRLPQSPPLARASPTLALRPSRVHLPQSSSPPLPPAGLFHSRPPPSGGTDSRSPRARAYAPTVARRARLSPGKAGRRPLRRARFARPRPLQPRAQPLSWLDAPQAAPGFGGRGACALSRFRVVQAQAQSRVSP
ncbi:skin secretory protein xP2-like [Suncus etruscus]|uniref:skin secretory protein xP2-like n=1 Tax=Suncus etruscus TaxID=109475 RepID=UPI0021104269|nr:skin secretory protein xP2-like [Suncus etruscus]